MKERQERKAQLVAVRNLHTCIAATQVPSHTIWFLCTESIVLLGMVKTYFQKNDLIGRIIFWWFARQSICSCPSKFRCWFFEILSLSQFDFRTLKTKSDWPSCCRLEPRRNSLGGIYQRSDWSYSLIQLCLSCEWCFFPLETTHNFWPPAVLKFFSDFQSYHVIRKFLLSLGDNHLAWYHTDFCR